MESVEIPHKKKKNLILIKKNLKNSLISEILNLCSFVVFLKNNFFHLILKNYFLF